MKHLTFTLLIILLAIGTLWSQQIPIFNNYVFNPMLYNPAAAGISDYGNLNLIHRSQWIEVPDGPVTNGLTFDLPFKDANIGVGATLFSDNTHILNRVSGSMVYAYHLPFNPDKDHRLSIGASIGILNQRINILDATVNEINDPALLDANAAGTTVDLSAGVIYTNKDF
ncbi:MAG: PorP/SprF family type IX secretion system membrane protein, partial [Bacteroidota bacterium]